jgi:putative oxidoreductase
MTLLKPFAPQLLSLLRFMSGLLVLQHGTAKYLNLPAGPMNNTVSG